MSKVLIIDDDLALLDILEASLQYAQFNVKAVRECPDLFALISSYQPDVVLLDYVLSGVNGGELCYQIKSNPSTSNLPVIIITAYPRMINSLDAYLCNAVLPKPFDLSDLLSTINACISDPSVSLKKQ